MGASTDACQKFQVKGYLKEKVVLMEPDRVHAEIYCLLLEKKNKKQKNCSNLAGAK